MINLKDQMSIKMKTQIIKLTFFVLVISFIGCQKDEDPKPLPESGYPTIYKILSQSEWNECNSEFEKINIYEGLRLNEYGFIVGEMPLNEKDSITEKLVIENLEMVISNFDNFLGIEKKSSLELENNLRIRIPFYTGGSVTIINHYFEVLEEFKMSENWSEMKSEFDFHDFSLTQYFVDNESFAGPTIHFYFNELNKTLKISGNWFPSALIPKENIYSKNDVISIAWDHILKTEGVDLWEMKHLFKLSTKVIYKKVLDNYEIRKCWVVKTTLREDLFYDVYIDTQTGEIISFHKRGWFY